MHVCGSRDNGEGPDVQDLVVISLGVLVELVYYESMKGKLKIKPIYECR